MDLSKKTDYALRMLASLVDNPEGVISVRMAAQENEVPYSFARAIQRDLAAAGIVENSRGAAGGMRLSVDPHDVTLLQLIEAVQGPVVVANCAYAGDDRTPCPRRDECHFTPVWCQAEKLLRGFFSSVTLYQLVAEKLSPVFTGSFSLVTEDQARHLISGEKDQ